MLGQNPPLACTERHEQRVAVVLDVRQVAAVRAFCAGFAREAAEGGCDPSRNSSIRPPCTRCPDSGLMHQIMLQAMDHSRPGCNCGCTRCARALPARQPRAAAIHPGTRPSSLLAGAAQASDSCTRSCYRQWITAAPAVIAAVRVVRGLCPRGSRGRLRSIRTRPSGLLAGAAQASDSCTRSCYRQWITGAPAVIAAVALCAGFAREAAEGGCDPSRTRPSGLLHGAAQAPDSCTRSRYRQWITAAPAVIAAVGVVRGLCPRGSRGRLRSIP